MKYILCFLMLSLILCEKSNSVACTEEFRYGLNVTLRDADNNEIITEDVTVTATDGSYVETLMLFEGLDTFIGAGERSGTYIIEVHSIDYQNLVLDNIMILADECHVIAEVVELILQPN